MTTYEHAMLGITMALAVGAHRRHGWALPVTTAVAAALPDWDVFSFCFGSEAYIKVHRTWGHNLLMAGGLGALTGGIGYLIHLSILARKQRRALLEGGETPPAYPSEFGLVANIVWVLFGVLGGLIHLYTDMFYPWPMPLLWPFEERRWVRPVFGWEEFPIMLLLLLLAMFTMYYNPRRVQLIACVTLAVLSGYWFVRCLMAGVSMFL